MPPPRRSRAVAGARIISGVIVLALLAYAYALRIANDDSNLFDFFGYFTNQTSLLISIVLIGAGVSGLRGRQASYAFSLTRGIAVACAIVVGVIYNVLVPGTGSAPPWVSVALHIVLPIAVVVDWCLLRDRSPLRWRDLWLVLPYPLIWMIVVLIRGRTDGWVPYGFLLPEHGAASLAAHVVGLVATLFAAGALVWGASQLLRDRR